MPATPAHLSCISLQVASQQDSPLLPAVACRMLLSITIKCLTCFQRRTQAKSRTKPQKLLKLLGKKLDVLVWQLPGST